MGDEEGGGERRRSPLLEQAQRIADMFMTPRGRASSTEGRLEVESRWEREHEENERISSETRRETSWTPERGWSPSCVPQDEKEETSRPSSPTVRLQTRIVQSLAKIGERAGLVAAAAVGRVREAAHGSPFAPRGSDKDNEATDPIAAHAYSEFFYEKPPKHPKDDHPTAESEGEKDESEKHSLKRTTTTVDTAVRGDTLPDVLPRSTVSTPLDVNVEADERSKAPGRNDEDTRLKPNENKPPSKFRISRYDFSKNSDTKSTISPQDPEEFSSSKKDQRDPRTKFQESLKDEPGTRTKSTKSPKQPQNPDHSEESLHTPKSSSTYHKNTKHQESLEDELRSKNKSSANGNKEIFPNNQSPPADTNEILSSLPKSKNDQQGTCLNDITLPKQGDIVIAQDKIGVDHPDDVPNKLKEESPPQQKLPQNQIVPAQAKRATGGGSTKEMRPDDISEDTSTTHGSNLLRAESKGEESAAVPGAGATGSARTLVPLAGRDSSSPDDDGIECECVELLRKYVNPPRVFIRGLEDYGEDEDQFIARRDCSDFSKRYLRCSNFWVSTCRPPTGNPPEEAIEQWKITCPPPPRRSLQQCIKDKEAEHEALRKQAIRDRDKGRHVPTAVPRLCRSIYDDDCVPPPKATSNFN